MPSLRAFDGGTSGDASEIAQALDTLGWWRETARREGFRADLAVETHDAFVSTEALTGLLAAAPDCPILWDSHHTWRKGGCDPVQTWALLRAHTRHIHVKDSVSRPGPRLPYSYVLPGTGEFPMAALRAALQADGYDGVLSLEWERLWHAELPPLDDALQQADRTGWWGGRP